MRDMSHQHQHSHSLNHTCDMHFHALASRQLTSTNSFTGTYPAMPVDDPGVDAERKVEVEYEEGNEDGDIDKEKKVCRAGRHASIAGCCDVIDAFGSLRLEGNTVGGHVCAGYSMRRTWTSMRAMTRPPSYPGSSQLVLKLRKSKKRTSQDKKQPLACWFCRERKIVCGRPDPNSSDRTCKFVISLSFFRLEWGCADEDGSFVHFSSIAIASVHVGISAVSTRSQITNSISVWGRHTTMMSTHPAWSNLLLCSDTHNPFVYTYPLLPPHNIDIWKVYSPCHESI